MWLANILRIYPESRLCAASIFQNVSYATNSCRRPIKMSLLCQIEMTLPGGFAELAYEPSVLKRAWSNQRKRLRRPVHRAAGERCATPGLRARPPPDPDDGDISIWSIWQKQ